MDLCLHPPSGLFRHSDFFFSCGVLLSHKKDTFNPFEGRWMHPENITPSEIKQMQKVKHNMVSFIQETQNVNKDKSKRQMIENRD